MNYLRLRNFNKSSLRNPASRSIAKSVPLGRKTKWLPVAWSSVNPFARRNAMTVRGVMLGSRGIGEIERRKEGLGVGWNRLVMLFQAFNVCLDSISRHCFCFAECASVCNASSERRNNDRISSLWFRPENDMIVRKFCFHSICIVTPRFCQVKSPIIVGNWRLNH